MLFILVNSIKMFHPRAFSAEAFYVISKALTFEIKMLTEWCLSYIHLTLRISPPSVCVCGGGGEGS
jgi:hypothetical protein